LLHLHHNSQDLDAAEIVRIVNEIDDPADAARTLVKSSAALWAEKNDYCDDITAIVIFIKHDNVGSPGIVARPIEINHEAKQVSSKSKASLSLFRRFLHRKKKKQSK
jgi:serine/threonine protein phosphatase PrpC